MLTTQDEQQTSASSGLSLSHSARQWRDLLLVLLAGTALLVAGVAGYGLAGAERPDLPTTGSVEAGFARDMADHHRQAVQMSLIAHDRSADPEVRYMTYDIATGQQAQIGMMTGWLSEWGLRQSSGRGPRMAWMQGSSESGMAMGGNDGDPMAGMRLLPDGRMPGMATQADVARLETLRGTALEVRWLQLMIAHHRGGVDMARAALARTDRPAVRQLAQSIADSQASEITQMQEMLRRRGAAPA